MISDRPLIEARNLSVEYKLGKRWLNALNDVSLTIRPREIHGLVGESGSGKSTLALAMMRYLSDNARIASGEVLFDGANLYDKPDADMRRIWGEQMSLVPQNPLASLNPSYTIGEQIAEITRHHQHLSRAEAWSQAVEMLGSVKIPDPQTVARSYPHQLSGGMQQRVTIAMALSTQPRLLVLDEPTTSLDVTTEAVILDLFRDLIRDHEAAALYVTHDLGIVAQMCDSMTVLYAGEVMASGPVRDVFTRPLHPYTIGLLASLPRPTSGFETRLPTIEGAAPSLAERPHACVFSDRCPVALPLCREVKPPLEEVGAGRWVKCHRWREIASGELQLQTAPLEQVASAPPKSAYVLEATSIRKIYDEPSLLDRL
ncbi:MAG: ABC transporter ATP-binding protein, partial [Burkholderiales bacterium]|nr:ABC transporter ATP-binding protein [Anaerolineae bacterium]